MQCGVNITALYVHRIFAIPADFKWWRGDEIFKFEVDHVQVRNLRNRASLPADKLT